jgi:hypothetical protein
MDSYKVGSLMFVRIRCLVCEIRSTRVDNVGRRIYSYTWILFNFLASVIPVENALVCKINFRSYISLRPPIFLSHSFHSPMFSSFFRYSTVPVLYIKRVWLNIIQNIPLQENSIENISRAVYYVISAFFLKVCLLQTYKVRQFNSRNGPVKAKFA